MAFDPRVAGFNADEVRAGLHLAMQIGLPVELSEQPTFVFRASYVNTGNERDSEGVALDWQVARTRIANDTTFQVPCAVEYFDGEGKIENFGVIVPSRLTLTLLDEDYQIIKGFDYVVIAGVQYTYRRTQPPLGLVDVGIYQVHVSSDDEG